MRKKMSVLSIVLILSLLLAACTAATQQVTPEVGDGGAATSVVTEALPDTGATEAATEAAIPTAVTEAAATEATEATEAATTEAPATTEAAATEAPETTEAAATESPEATEAGAAATSPATGPVDLSRISNMLNQPVQGAGGAQLGTVEDVAIDLPTAQIAWVLVRAPGAEGEDERVLPVPWRAFNTEAGALNSELDATILEGATEMDPRAAPVMIPSDWSEEFGVFWDEQLGADPAATEAPAATEEAAAEEGAQGELEGIVLTRNILDRSLALPDGTEIGALEDILLDPSTGQVTYVLLTAGEATGAAGQVIPIPLQALRRDLATGAFQLPTGVPDLSQFPAFTLEDLPDTSVQDWDTALREFWEILLPQPAE